jgi:putative serine protease PepD
MTNETSGKDATPSELVHPWSEPGRQAPSATMPPNGRTAGVARDAEQRGNGRAAGPSDDDGRGPDGPHRTDSAYDERGRAQADSGAQSEAPPSEMSVPAGTGAARPVEAATWPSAEVLRAAPAPGTLPAWAPISSAGAGGPDEASGRSATADDRPGEEPPDRAAGNADHTPDDPSDRNGPVDSDRDGRPQQAGPERDRPDDARPADPPPPDPAGSRPDAGADDDSATRFADERAGDVPNSGAQSTSHPATNAPPSGSTATASLPITGPRPVGAAPDGDRPASDVHHPATPPAYAPEPSGNRLGAVANGETVTDPYGMRRYFGEPVPRQPTTGLAAPPPRRNRSALLALGAVALVAALLGGVLGGVIGSSLTDRSRPGAGLPGVLEQPLPDPAQAEAPAGPVEAVAARVLPSVVQLRIEGARASGEGSGIVLSPDGLLLTNNHVVEAAANGGTVTVVFQDGATAPAQIVGRDPGFDLAVLRAGNVSGLTPIELGNSDAVRVGQQVIAFGSPLGLGGTVTTGIISAIDRPVSVGGDRVANESTVLNALQTDAAINPGNSGGPLVDMQGKLIGINSAIATTGAEGGSIGVGFSIPVNQAKRVAEELERTGKATRAQLGVSVGDDPRVSGARIRSVDPNSAAAKAGLKGGDVVLRFGDQRILSGEGLQAAVRSRAPGETVPIELTDRTLTVTLDVVS